MQKVIHPIVDKHVKIKPENIGLNNVKSLAELTSKVPSNIRETFLSKEGFGYVWCFSSDYSFDDSLLSKIQDGEWHPLHNLANHPSIQDIVYDLRQVYNAVSVEFHPVVFDNSFYDPCIIGDVLFGRHQKEAIIIKLAVKGSEQMAQGLENVLNNYGALQNQF